ncbi:hypothetical protein ACERII_09225 [Evansella sp. AB-rgal1]|uniref:hypothetical protein n=1 Tax=Evansella sp. AB-rgal1 TaxID=3242696 RepID=UPI00359EA8F7
MNQKRFDKGMDELKNKYNETPSETSASTIFKSVQNDKRYRERRKSFFSKYGGVAAAMIGVIFIIGILFNSVMSGFHMGSSDSNEAASDDAGYHYNDDSGDGRSAEEGSPTSEHDVLSGSDDTSNNSNEELDYDDNADYDAPFEDRFYPGEREDMLIKEVDTGGRLERVIYELYWNEELQFSTYINPTFDLSISGNIGTGSVKIFMSENSWLWVSRLNSTDIDGFVEDYYSELIARGFEEMETGPQFDTVERYSRWAHSEDGVFLDFAVLRDGDSIYYMEAQQPVVAENPLFEDALETFVNELVFE